MFKSIKKFTWLFVASLFSILALANDRDFTPTQSNSDMHYKVQANTQKLQQHYYGYEQFIYLGVGTYNSGNELEYNMMMADKTLIPKDDKDYFSKVTLTSDDDFIYLTITNFLQTNTQHFKVPKQYR